MDVNAEMDEGDGNAVWLVHERLSAAILDGSLEAGSIISQTALADLIGASRTPVREAVRLLAHEGLVIAEANRRVRIRPFTPTNLEDLQVGRIALENAGIRLTVPRLKPEDLAELEGLLAQMRHYHKVEDLARFEVPHQRFHLKLISELGPIAVGYAKSLHEQVRSYRLAFGSHEDFSTRQDEHRRILDYAIAGNVGGAASELVQHYLGVVTHVFPALDPGFEPKRVQELAAQLATPALN